MKINILRAFWNFEVNELSTASGGKSYDRPGGKNSCYATALQADTHWANLRNSFDFEFPHLYAGGCRRGEALVQDFVFMRPSSLGGGRILRRTLSVRLSVCPSVRPSRYR